MAQCADLWCSLLLLLLAGQCLSTVPHGLSLALTTLTLAQARLHSAMSASAACPPEPLAEARPGFPRAGHSLSYSLCL